MVDEGTATLHYKSGFGLATCRLRRDAAATKCRRQTCCKRFVLARAHDVWTKLTPGACFHCAFTLQLAGLVRNRNATPGGSPAAPPQPGGAGNAAAAGPAPTGTPTPAGKPAVDDLTRLLLMPRTPGGAGLPRENARLGAPLTIACLFFACASVVDPAAEPDRAPSAAAAAATATPPPATPPAAAAAAAAAPKTDTATTDVDNPLLRALLGGGPAAAPATPTRSASRTPPEAAAPAPAEPTTPAAKPAAPADASAPEEDPFLRFFKMIGMYPPPTAEAPAAASTPAQPSAAGAQPPLPPPPRAPVTSSGSASPSTMVLVSPSSGLAPRPPAGSQQPAPSSAPSTPDLAHTPRADGAVKAPAPYIAAAPTPGKAEPAALSLCVRRPRASPPHGNLKLNAVAVPVPFSPT